MISVKKDSSFFFLLLSLFPSFSFCFDECQQPFSKSLAWLDYCDVPYYGNNHVAIFRPLGNLTTKPNQTSWVWDPYLFLGQGTIAVHWKSLEFGSTLPRSYMCIIELVRFRYWNRVYLYLWVRVLAGNLFSSLGTSWALNCVPRTSCFPRLYVWTPTPLSPHSFFCHWPITHLKTTTIV